MYALVAAAVLSLGLGTALTARAGQTISLATSQPGGATFEIGTAIGKVISDSSGGEYEVSPAMTGGSTANIRVLQKTDALGPFRMGMVTTPAVYWGQTGEKPFKEKQDVLVLATLYPLTVAYVTRKDSGIKEWKDVVGRRFVVGGRGGSIYIVTQNALRYSKLYDKVNREFFTNPQNAAAIKDNRVDAGFFMLNGMVPAPVYMDLARTQMGELHWFGPDEDTIKQLEQQDPGIVRDVIPAGTIPGQDEDVVTWAQMWALVASSQMSAETAHDMVRLLFENHQQIVKYHPIGKHIRPENALRGVSQLKMHPGAARYWKEKGQR